MQNQPIPGSGVPTHDLVSSDFSKRRAFGISKYGVDHQHDNGRDHLLDLYEELMDAVIYARAEIEKRKACLPPSDPSERFAWIRPPWIDNPGPTDPDSPGEWPWVGDLFLAAIQFSDAKNSAKIWWEFAVLKLSETGLEYADSGDSYDSCDPSDIGWIARLPTPPKEGSL